jgi:hypothetical protein
MLRIGASTLDAETAHVVYGWLSRASRPRPERFSVSAATLAAAHQLPQATAAVSVLKRFSDMDIG